jgi:hypothetical protein
MGTVRREGDWRLEKRRDGVYEITFRREPQLKIYTGDAPSGAGYSLAFDTLPTRRVSSYSEAEGLFEEKAHGPRPMGFSSSKSTTGRANANLTDEADLADLPPGAIGLVLIIAGSLVLYTLWDANTQYGLLIGLGFVAGGITILAYGAYLFKMKGWREAWDFLATAEGSGSSSKSSSGGSNQEKTPPAPESLRNELFFERANRRCEYCNEQIDQPDIHHIVSRSEGGPNERNNLIVLCPNCHRKADNGMISKSKLRYQLND